MVTSYNVASMKWYLYLSNRHVIVLPSVTYVWNAICKVPYKVFIDNDMQVELFSSSRPSTITSPTSPAFFTPLGFMEEFYDLYKQRIVAKIVILVELSLPMNDYSIKCSDGSVVASRIVLNVSNKFMRKHFKESKDAEMVVEHSVDVVRPIIIYLHSLCFEMPKCFDLDYADRLLKAIDFFQIEQKDNIRPSIELSLCQKFVEEVHDFDSLLKWLSVANRNHFFCLSDMICAVMSSNKFYFKWNETFPENARVVENPIYRNIFGFECPACIGHIDIDDDIFSTIEYTFMCSLSTNIILP